MLDAGILQNGLMMAHATMRYMEYFDTVAFESYLMQSKSPTNSFDVFLLFN